MTQDKASDLESGPEADRAPLLGQSLEDLRSSLAGMGEPKYRAAQLFEWVYSKRTASFEEMLNLPSELRRLLESRYHLRRPEVVRRQVSADGTCKYLFGVEGGRTESVLIPEPSRTTFCISSQVGCALDCKFCLTATLGFGRHLGAGEIVSQVMTLLAEAGPLDHHPNIVFMGMGEPLHNYEQVLKAFRLLTDQKGMAIPRRKITVSTAGMVPAIRKMTEEKERPRLAISLNASEDETRSRIMPINRKHPIAELMEAAARYPESPRHPVMFEYVMLDQVNSELEDAARLLALFRAHDVKAKVNLIPFNSGGGLPFRAPPDDQIRRFQRTLIDGGYACSIRKNRGRDISAACGQLALVETEK